MLVQLYGGEESRYIRNPDLTYDTKQGVTCSNYDPTNPNGWDTNKDEMMSFLSHHNIQGVAPVFDNRGYVSEFFLDRRHTEILITGYDVKRRAAVIDRWLALVKISIHVISPQSPVRPSTVGLTVSKS